MAGHWVLVAADDGAAGERAAEGLGVDPTTVVRAGRLALVATEGLVAAADGRAVCGFLGVVFDIVALADRLAGRGLAFGGGGESGEVRRVVAEWCGHGGPEALGSARWQGAIACLHPGQRLAFVARDAVGAGSLWGARLGAAWAFATAPELVKATLPGSAPFALPPGLVVRLGQADVAARPIAFGPEHAAFYRQLPVPWPPSSVAEVRVGLALRLAAALHTTRLCLGPVNADAPTTAAERWLAGLCPVKPDPAARALWVRTGAETLLGALAEPGATWATAPGPFDRLEPPEPLAGVDPAERRQRELRATWLADGVLGAAHAMARAQGWLACTPHLDPAVLAYLGALPADLRARLRDEALHEAGPLLP